MHATVSQAFFILCLAAIVSGGAALIDKHILSYFHKLECDQSALPEGRICLTTALNEWNNKIIWVDARSEDAYERGTINQPNVIPLRNDKNAQLLLSKGLPILMEAAAKQWCVIIFCDKDCNSSQDIANVLKKYHIKAPIFILENGWSAIVQDPSLTPSRS